MAKTKAVDVGPDAEWQAEDDMRTLARAEEIRRDPKRLAKAKDMAKKKLAELKTVAEVKA